MTVATNAKKRCDRCRDIEAYRGACNMCHGLGWLPAPGDVLTQDEAKKLFPNVSVGNGDDQIPAIEGDLKYPYLRFFYASAPKEGPELCLKCGEAKSNAYDFQCQCKEEPAAKVESVDWEAQAKAAAAYIEALEWPAKFAQGKAPKSGYYETFLKIEERRAAYRSTLTPAQLEALRKERA